MIERLREWAAERGYAVAVGHPSVLDRAASDIRARLDSGEVAEQFRNDIVPKYGLLESSRTSDATAVLMLAIPRPAHAISFETRSGKIEAIVPPTYVRYPELWREVREQMDPVIPRERLSDLRAPHKAVAARLGLTRYGRNNIAYAPGMGSYHQLVGFVTDVDRGASLHDLRDPEMQPECEKCTLCRRACPTGAIPENRFLLHAEKCLTWFTEQPGAWPDWLSPAAHNAIIGCMICQEKCPVNRGKLKVEHLEPAFTDEETATIMGTEFDLNDAVWRSVQSKLDSMGLGRFEHLGRNLRALLERP
ncbi:MAG: hypothetical protein HPY55_02740 [Firmicutes bacterium]|nr:hypothetical protein [Bacillota bacterium]